MAIKSITENDYPEVIKDYLAGYAITRLRKKYKTSLPVINSILKDSGIYIKNSSERCKKYSVNISYFGIINTEAKAYFLGLLYADGSVTKNNKTLEIGLSGEDELDLLKSFKKECDYTGEIKKKKKVNESNKQHYRLTITDTIFVSNLIKQGVINNKSLVLKFPTEEQVPRNLIRHFIRGYWDGDGTINHRKNDTLNVGALCSNFFFKEFNDVIFKNLGFKFGVYSQGNNSDIKIGGIANPIKFCEWIYNNSSIYLKRKRKKFEEFLVCLSEKQKAKNDKLILSKEAKEKNSRLRICTIKTQLKLDQQSLIRDLMSKNLPKRQICKILGISNSALDNFLRIIGQYKVYKTK